jgi:hypothetical protein
MMIQGKATTVVVRIVMPYPNPAPPLPQPAQPVPAAKALAEAAQAAADSWARPLDPDRNRRAISQLYSTVHAIGTAARGIAAWQPTDSPPGATPAGFTRHVISGAALLLSAWSRFNDVLTCEGAGELPDPDEPGTVLYHTARDTILACRQPSGSSHDRDATLRQLITATGILSAAMASLVTCAPRHRAIGLQAAVADLSEAITNLAAAIEEPGCGPDPEPETPNGPKSSRWAWMSTPSGNQPLTMAQPITNACIDTDATHSVLEPFTTRTRQW